MSYTEKLLFVNWRFGISWERQQVSLFLMLPSPFNINKTGSRKFCQRGSTFDKLFLVHEGIGDPNTAINGPSSARQRNAIEMAFRWRADDGPTLNDVLVAL